MSVLKTKKDLIEVIDLGMTLAEQMYEILEDNKFSFRDIDNLVCIYNKINPAIKDFDKAIIELKSLTVDEAKELHHHIKKEFDIPDDEVEIYVESAIDLAINLANLFGLFKKSKEQTG